MNGDIRPKESDNTLQILVEGVDTWPATWIFYSLLESVDKKRVIKVQVPEISPSKNSINIEFWVMLGVTSVQTAIRYFNYRKTLLQTPFEENDNAKYVVKVLPEFRKIADNFIKYCLADGKNKLKIRIKANFNRGTVEYSAKSLRGVYDSPFTSPSGAFSRGALKEKLTKGQHRTIVDLLMSAQNQTLSGAYLKSIRKMNIKDLTFDEAENLIEKLQK